MLTGRKANARPGKFWIHYTDTRHEVIGDTLNLEEVLLCVGSDNDFNAYIRTLPSCLSGAYSEYFQGEPMCIAAHISRAATKGIAFKAPYHTVPLTHAEHIVQHQKGYGVHKPWEWWLDRLRHYRERWASDVLTTKLSLNGNLKHDIDALLAWADRHCLKEMFDQRLQKI